MQADQQSVNAGSTRAMALALAVQMQTLMPSGHHRARLLPLFALAREVCGLRP